MNVPRLRMFAGPNGSGKSTIKSVVSPELLGVYLNPDEIEKENRDRDFLDLRAYGVEATREEILLYSVTAIWVTVRIDLTKATSRKTYSPPI